MNTNPGIAEFKLQTVFNSDDTVSHINDKSGLVFRTTWTRDKELGVGRFGEVWREKDTEGQLRAVKTISRFTLKSNKINYERELQVLIEVREV